MSIINNKKLPEWLIDKLPQDIDVGNAAYLSQRFEDSTHDLWRLQSKQGDYFLKVCSNTDSPFWKIMQQLFGVNLKQEIQSFSKLYNHIAGLTSVRIPELIQSESINVQGSYILTAEVEGSVPDNSNISMKMVEQLAEHLAHLHQDQHKNWGLIHNPLFEQNDWQKRLSDTLEKSTQLSLSRNNVGAQRRRPEGRDEIESKWGGDKQSPIFYLEKALDACNLITNLDFVPLMPDLRWDQFLVSKEDIILLDLDAFVLAPRELDFVLLEYLLDEQQIAYFIETYSKLIRIPNIDSIRPAYRLLLFYMQVLGEQDIDRWMKKPTFFKE